MSRVKYPIVDEDFLIKSKGACNDDEEMGLLFIGFFFGMHPWSITQLNPESIKIEGKKHYLYWVRPRNHKTMRGEIPKEILSTIKNFINNYRRKTRQQYDNIIRAICKRAGYDNVSMMTLRHTHCLYQHTNRGVPLFSLHHVMGCTMEVVGRNYTQSIEEIEKGFRYKIPWETLK